MEALFFSILASKVEVPVNCKLHGPRTILEDHTKVRGNDRHQCSTKWPSCEVVDSLQSGRRKQNKPHQTSTMAQTLPMVSTNERAQLAQLRIEAVKTRPSTVAAQEFFAGDRKSKSLPRRIRRLTQVLESWVRRHGIFVMFCRGSVVIR